MVPSIFLILSVLLLQQHGVGAADTAAVLVPPVSVRVGLGHDPVFLTCHVEADNLYWIINGDFQGQNIDLFQRKGIMVDDTSYNGDIIQENLTVAISEANNNTMVVCEASTSNIPIVTSDTATVFIAGVPLPPSPTFTVMDVSTILVEWEEPFTWQDFPIINYTMEVFNQTSDELITSSVLDPDTLYFTHTRPKTGSSGSSGSCTDLTFSVVAHNSVGASVPGTVEGAFPTLSALEPPTHEITFSQNHSPILKINFTFPSLCSHQSGSYVVVIEKVNGELVHKEGPVLRHWSNTESLITIEIRDVLELNAEYRVTINLNIITGQPPVNSTFNVHVPPGLSMSSSPDIVAVIGSIFGTILCIGVVVLLAVCSIYLYRRTVKRKRDCINTSEVTCTGLRQQPMVPNPIYEGSGGAIYEEIGVKPLKALTSQRTCTEAGLGDIGLTSDLSTCTDDIGLTSDFSRDRAEGEYVTIATPGMPAASAPEHDKGALAMEKQEEMYTVMNPVIETGRRATGSSEAVTGPPGNGRGAAAISSPQVPVNFELGASDGASAVAGQAPSKALEEDRYVIT